MLASSLHDHQALPSRKCRILLKHKHPLPEFAVDYSKWCMSLELGNERILREIQMIPWSCKQKQSAQLNASQTRSNNSRSAKLLVARLTMNRSIKRKELQCHLLTCKPKRVTACTKHLAHAVPSSKSFHTHFLPVGSLSNIISSSIRSLFHLWTDHDYHHGSMCPLQQKDQSHFATNAMTCQGSSRSD